MNIIFFIVLIIQINYIICQEYESKIEKTSKINGVYRIDSKNNDFHLIYERNEVKFSKAKPKIKEYFRIIPTENNLYFIEFKALNKNLGVDKNGTIKLFEKKTYWNITQLNNSKYIIQNNYTKNFLEIKDEYPVCLNKLENITNDKISDNFIFTFFKIFEEVLIKPEHIKLIEDEPVDVLIKYIDLSDNTLSRANIKQVKKDEDNEELKYCVRSILENIPWIRKIFILMPNDKVKYFKPIEEIKEKIVYVKDKDFLGFDSSNSNTFQYNLYNMEKFGISDNFILMDDDYFIGKPINKTKFFYYDEKQKKVLPSIVSDDLSELNKEDTISKLNKINRKRNINLHSFYGWKLAQLNAFLFLLEQFGSPLINAGFTHNAIPININDMKELFDLMKNNYTDANEILYAKERTIHDLQFQSLYMTYSLNVKKRKVNSIPWIYIDLGEANLKSLNIELFVINTSGDRIYKKEEYQTAKDILEIKFNKPTKYEIVLFDKTENISHNTNKSIDNNQSKNIEIQKQINDSSQILNKYQKN